MNLNNISTPNINLTEISIFGLFYNVCEMLKLFKSQLIK